MSSVLSQQILQHEIVQHLIRKQAFELGILILERLQLGRVRHFHFTLLGFELIERALAEPVLAAHLSRRHPSFLFFDHSDDLRFCKTALSHVFAPSKG